MISAILCILTVQSRDTYFYSSSFHTFLTCSSDTIVPAKKKNIPVDEKLKSKNDSLPQKIVSIADTIHLNKNDTLPVNDSLGLTGPTDTINYITSKNAPDTVIEYTAEDSMVVDVPGKTITLYGQKATTQYKDNNLTAPIIALDQETGNITAAIKRDSTGKVISLPSYKQGDFSSESDSIKFNMKTGKGLTKSTYTTQGEMYVYGQVIKKVDNNVFYALRGRFTTCNLDTPHFAFVSNKIKFINNKMAITGPVHPEFEGVPIPIYFPFGIYPLNQGRHSGLLQATFTTSQQRGLGLENLGYYKVINDYWDVIFRGSIYSYGGWTLSVNPRYKKNYRYSGNLQFDIQNFNTNFKGDPDFSHNRSYHIAWSHTMDTKARPGVTFTANVNAGSSSYNRNVPDQPNLNYSNQLQSSIAYSKTFGKANMYNLTLTANHNQNTNLKIINVNLPTVGFNVATVYPFRRKEAAGTLKWYENIGIAYNGNAENRFSFYDTLPHIFQQIKDTLQFGFHHSVPISLSLPQIGAFQVGPSVSYDETWYQTKTQYSWDAGTKRLDTTVQKGFYTARQMSFGLSVSTRIFGLITAKKKNSKIIAVRHEITPTLGINFKPEFNKGSFYYVQYDTAGHKQQFSVYQRNNIFSPYSPGRFGGLTFGIDNNISMKVRNKKDTGENAIKKISIIDGFSISGSYNFFADSLSFPLSDFPVSIRSNLFNKINITASGILDPYEIDAQGRRIKTLVWRNKILSLGRLISGSISLSTSLQGGKKSSDKKTELTSNTNGIDDLGYTQDQYDAESAYIRNNPGEFADFSIPWSVNLSYSLTYSKNYIVPLGYVKTVSQNVNFGGTLGITKKWQTSVNGYYNITLGQLNTVSATLSRDLHCWQMSISLSPVGIYRFFSISISPKSTLLRDLRVNRTRYFYNNL